MKDLIEKYHAGTLTREELAKMQKLLTRNDVFRREFLLYAQVEVTLENQVLFHNELERPIESSGTSTQVPKVSSANQVSVNDFIFPQSGPTQFNLGEL